MEEQRLMRQDTRLATAGIRSIFFLDTRSAGSAKWGVLLSMQERIQRNLSKAFHPAASLIDTIFLRLEVGLSKLIANSVIEDLVTHFENYRLWY